LHNNISFVVSLNQPFINETFSVPMNQYIGVSTDKLSLLGLIIQLMWSTDLLLYSQYTDIIPPGQKKHPDKKHPGGILSYILYSHSVIYSISAPDKNENRWLSMLIGDTSPLELLISAWFVLNVADIAQPMCVKLNYMSPINVSQIIIMLG
jgi:hypothetical protein